jgi:hypothetical protein
MRVFWRSWVGVGKKAGESERGWATWRLQVEEKRRMSRDIYLNDLDLKPVRFVGYDVYATF